jgi:plasmid maintenance system antidote protein VapI
MNTLGIYLKENDIRQAQFAARLGVTQGTVSKLCRRGVVIRSDMMMRIERLTGGKVPSTSWIAQDCQNHGGACRATPSETA